MGKKVKKIINDPKNLVSEMIDGMVLASNGGIKRLDNFNGIVRPDIPTGKVALLIGGGSGHEPMFHGFVGHNLADGAPCGNIFAAPTPDLILEVTKAVNRGNGVLYLYNNYAGDNMNFDIAMEMAIDEGIDVRTVRIYDDVAAFSKEQMTERRGIAGDVLIIKVSGAACATVNSLDEAVRITTAARDNTRSIGVAVSAGSMPETGEPTFILADDEIEIGMGAHGEPGVSREKLKPADPLTDDMMAALLAEEIYEKGDEVAVVVNSLGATTMMELLIVNRRIRQILDEKGISVYRTELGPYLTCQEMAGFSISLMKLNAELKQYLDMPASSIGYRKL